MTLPGKREIGAGPVRLLLLLALATWPSEACAGSPQTNLVENGGFEQWRAAEPDADRSASGWQLGQPPVIPERWVLNESYPGELLRGASTPAAETAYLILRKAGSRVVHLFQNLDGLQPGRWYRFSARVRGGEISARAYQYYGSAPMNMVDVARGRAPTGEWKPVVGYYRVPERDWQRSALALVLDSGGQVDVDEVGLYPATVPTPEPGTPDIVLENEAARLILSPTGELRELRDKVSGENYLGAASRPMITVVHQGNELQTCMLSRSVDRLEFRFPESDVRLTLGVASGPQHLRFRVLDFSPGDLESVRVTLPFKRLETLGRAFNATYDAKFGLSFFGTTATARSVLEFGGKGVLLPTVSAGSRHGIMDAGMALVAAPRGRFKAALMEAERAAGLPCPMLDGEWARDSDSVRRSYLFAKPIAEAEIDSLIDYAKIGGFETILFQKNSWLANHGHFDVNTEAFPRGIASLRDAVRKIHEAGLQAGVHLFGPSISPNDPYVTPVPDRRLASVSCPPLAVAMDEESTTVEFTSPPPLPPRTREHRVFPGRYLRIGDEIIAFKEHEDGPPFRYVDVQRGALGTAATAHPAGAAVRGLLALHGFFLLDPDSTLADEVTDNFARVFNAAEFDFVYFDASDGTSQPYVDTWYYMGKLHMDFYRKLGRDVLYQTSLGTGRGLLWHIVPRSASADGRGDIKGYLDERWSRILRMEDDFTRADVGWYMWYGNVRPDQIEYVSAKVAGIEGSFSLETSKHALEQLPQSRQMLETVGRWERCRRAGGFTDGVRAELREPGQDFKLFVDDGECRPYRVIYEAPRVVKALDGRQNAWVIDNERNAVLLGIEIVRPAAEAQPGMAEGRVALKLNGRVIGFGVGPRPGEAITSDGIDGATLWPRAMAPGRPLQVVGPPMKLRPGENTVILSWDPLSAFPSGVEVRLYRLWPLEPAP